jgi:uncharacterized metal-binding protein
MSDTIVIPLSAEHCPLGEAYAHRHLTTPAKAAVLSCEGACLRGEIARRAANVLTRELAPDRTVRICHGGLLESGGGMRALVTHADQVLMLDGCAMRCGARLLRAAMPEVRPAVMVTDQMFELDSSSSAFALDDMSERDTAEHARAVAAQIVDRLGIGSAGAGTPG